MTIGQGTQPNAFNDDLLAQVASGDRFALQSLITHALPQLSSLCQALTGNEIEAELISNEVLRRATLKATPKTSEALWRLGLRLWLYDMAIELWTDKRWLKNTLLDLSDTEALSLDEGGHPLSPSHAKDPLEGAFHDLPERQKLALILCVYQDLSSREAAMVLGISIEVLENLLIRGRRQILSAVHAKPQTQSLLKSKLPNSKYRRSLGYA
jgi:RNA polymerase sigma-70 factor, ECF subfamily